jgi:hypothetical protein
MGSLLLGTSDVAAILILSILSSGLAAPSGIEAAFFIHIEAAFFVSMR